MDSFAKLMPLGKTWAGSAIDSSQWSKTAELEGLVACFSHDGSVTYTGFVPSDSAGRVVAVLARNVSESDLRPGQVVVWDAANIGKRVSGYANTGLQARLAGVVDPALTTRVQNGDLFWVIVAGPTKIKTVASGLSAFAAGDLVSVGDNSGRINKASISPADASSALASALSILGVAMEARGTSDTNRLTKVMLRKIF